MLALATSAANPTPRSPAFATSACASSAFAAPLGEPTLRQLDLAASPAEPILRQLDFAAPPGEPTLRQLDLAASAQPTLRQRTFAALAAKQYSRPRQPLHTGPRAVALVLPRSDSLRAADTRVRNRHIILPVTLFYQGQYYDAALYKATPTPMALLAETVYEVQQGGEPIGSITVEDAGSFNHIWQGEGRLRLQNDAADRTAASPTTAPASSPGPPPDERPILRRHSASSAPPNPKPSAAAPLPPQAPAPPPSPPASPPAPSAITNANKVLVAVSDADTTTESHSFELKWSAAEQARLTRSVTALASSAVAKYLADNFPAGAWPPAPPRSGTKTRSSSSASSPALQEVQVRAFDLDSDNDPEIVLTAQLPAPGGNAGAIYVTLVARQQGGVDWRTLFSYVTDDARLDVSPRLEFIDAIDADGDGIAELLFRSFTAPAGGRPAYRLYHPYGDRLRLVYDSRGEQ